MHTSAKQTFGVGATDNLIQMLLFPTSSISKLLLMNETNRTILRWGYVMGKDKTIFSVMR